MASFEQRPTGSIIASLSWQSFLSAVGAMPKIFISAMMAWMIMETALFFIPGAANIVAHPNRVWVEAKNIDLYLAVYISQTILFAAIFAPVAVAMHRFILLNETSSGMISLRSRHTRLFFIWLTALQLAFGVPDELIGPGTSFSFQVAYTLGVSIVVTIVSIHLAMIFPAVATDVPSESWRARTVKSWQQMRGHAWLFFRAGLWVGVPIMMAGLVVWLLIVFLQNLFGSLIDTLHHLPPLYGVLLTAALQPFAVALAAATASWMYAWASQPRRESPLPQLV